MMTPGSGAEPFSSAEREVVEATHVDVEAGLADLKRRLGDEAQVPGLAGRAARARPAGERRAAGEADVQLTGGRGGTALATANTGRVARAERTRRAIVDAHLELL